MRTLGLMFLAALSMASQLPRLLTPGVGAAPRQKRTPANRFTGAASTLKTSLRPSSKQIRHKAGLVFRRIAGTSPLWGFGNGPHLAT